MSAPNLRVVTTGHTTSGSSIITSDTTVQPTQHFGPSGPSFAVLDAQSSVPASNHPPSPSHLKDLNASLPRCPPAGVLFSVATYPPGFSAPAAHRTPSRDYGVVVDGEIVLTLDEGQETTLRRGDFLVQGGTNHRWSNRGEADCRVAFVMVGADQVGTVGGEEMGEAVRSQ
ncbi:hypothetical protein BJ166DRAFT_306650 [Pestalotiopsis sp. NC0098]|nr:hypothetical protein BJ166DRAFT_306650 [Pestalotiopsis sp. NC0098]